MWTQEEIKKHDIWNMKFHLPRLKAARDLLDRAYIKWKIDDGDGGHCAVGAIQEESASYFDLLLFEVAKELHPELKGVKGIRENRDHTMHGHPLEIPYREFVCYDHFDHSPIVYLNNHVGKDAILFVFDVTIRRVELEIAAYEKSLLPERKAEAVPEPEPELALV